MKLREMLEKRNQIKVEMRELTKNPKGEVIKFSDGREERDLDEAQEKRFQELVAESNTLERLIDRQAVLDENDRRMQGQPLTGGNRGATPERRAAVDFLRDVVAYGTPGGMATRAAGQSEGLGTDGGFLVNTDFNTSLMGSVWSSTQVAPLVRRVTLSAGANSIELPTLDESSRADGSRLGGAGAYWTAESNEITASKIKFRNITMKLNKLASIYYASDELLQGGPALASMLSGFYATEIAFQIDDAIINGTGAGQPLGILNSPALVTVAKEAGQTADTLMWENILKMWVRMYPRGRANAVWCTGAGVESQLYQMALAVGTSGMPVFLPGGNASGAPYSTLFGRPIIPVEQLPPLGDKGDIMLVDPSQYVLVDKGGINEASSIGVRFEYAETAFRAVYRVDGAPTWNSAVTQYSGGETVSPFVCLAARA